MNKLQKMRAFLIDAVPTLKRDPDKLLVFAEEGHLENPPRAPHLSFTYHYTASLVLTDFGADPDTVVVPLLAWLKKNQPDRADLRALEFSAEILNNKDVDIEIRVPLTEFVAVTDNGNGTVSTDHLGEPIYVGDTFQEGIDDPLTEWQEHNG